MQIASRDSKDGVLSYVTSGVEPQAVIVNQIPRAGRSFKSSLWHCRPLRRQAEPARHSLHELVRHPTASRSAIDLKPHQRRQLLGAQVERPKRVATQRQSRGDVLNVHGAQAMLGRVAMNQRVEQLIDLPIIRINSHYGLTRLEQFLHCELGHRSDFRTDA